MKELFRQFKKEVSRKFCTWERGPDQYTGSE